VKKWPKLNLTHPILVKINTKPKLWGKAAQNFGLPYVIFSKNCPKKAICIFWGTNLNQKVETDMYIDGANSTRPNAFATFNQGDQMSLGKNRPKRSPSHFWSKLIQNLNCVEKQTNILGYSNIFKKWPKESNRPIVENSPNLVTLLLTELVICRSEIRFPLMDSQIGHTDSSSSFVAPKTLR
jgi:hypothetical protein